MATKLTEEEKAARKEERRKKREERQEKRDERRNDSASDSNEDSSSSVVNEKVDDVPAPELDTDPSNDGSESDGTPDNETIATEATKILDGSPNDTSVDVSDANSDAEPTEDGGTNEESSESEESKPRPSIVDENGNRLASIDMPQLAEVSTKAGSGIKVTDVNGETKTLNADEVGAKKEDDGLGNDSWSEYLRQLYNQQRIDEAEKAALEAQLAKKEKDARISQAIASIGDVGSAIANIWGTASWGSPFKPSNSTGGIRAEMDKARERYTKNINLIRERIRKGQDTAKAALHYKAQEEQQARKTELAEKKFAQETIRDEWRRQIETLKLDMRQAELDERIERYAKQFELREKMYGSSAALAWARIEIAREAEERRAYEAEEKRKEKERESNIKAAIGKWDSIKNDVLVKVFGSTNVNRDKLTDEQRSIYDAIILASDDKKKRAVIMDIIVNLPSMNQWAIDSGLIDGTPSKKEENQPKKETETKDEKKGGWSL